MKLLLTSDLHSCTTWYEWLLEQAGHVDFIAIAGDLVEGFAPGNHRHELHMAEHYLRKVVERGCHVAVCSGNHELFLKKSIHVPEKPSTALNLLNSFLHSGMPDTPDHPLFIQDGQTKLVTRDSGSLIVTTIPYRIDVGCLPSSIMRLWEVGEKLRAEHGYPWLVLHHEPPCGTRVGGHIGHLGVISDIDVHRPDYLLSGHLHQQPFVSGGAFQDRIGNTLCLNAGQVDPGSSATPNHIILETANGDIRWNHFWQDDYRR